MKKVLMTILLVLLCALLACGILLVHRNNREEAAIETAIAAANTPVSTATPVPSPSYDPALFTNTDSLLLIANKKHPLPSGYVPADLTDVNALGGHGTIAPMMRQEAAEAEAEMTKAAAEDGLYLSFSSAYRSEDYQRLLYNGYVSQYGQGEADTISSRPGYSDHQTGLAADFIEGGNDDFVESFENTASGKWLYENAWKYGFVIRYPKGKQEITGYAYEPWHYRYIGKEYAAEMHTKDPDISIEEYFGVEGGDYAQ